MMNIALSDTSRRAATQFPSPSALADAAGAAPPTPAAASPTMLAQASPAQSLASPAQAQAAPLDKQQLEQRAGAVLAAGRNPVADDHDAQLTVFAQQATDLDAVSQAGLVGTLQEHAPASVSAFLQGDRLKRLTESGMLSGAASDAAMDGVAAAYNGGRLKAHQALDFFVSAQPSSGQAPRPLTAASQAERSKMMEGVLYDSMALTARRAELRLPAADQPAAAAMKLAVDAREQVGMERAYDRLPEADQRAVSRVLAEAWRNEHGAAAASPWAHTYGDTTASVDARVESALTGIYADGPHTGRLPNTDGLTDAQKGDLYSRLMLDTADHARDKDATYTDPTSLLGALPGNARTAFEAGQAVQFGMRNPTGPDANNGRGSFDDRIVVLQKQSDNTVKVLYEGSFNADPAGSYQQGSPVFGAGRSSKQAEGRQANGDGVLDLGRLREGVYEMNWYGAKQSFGPAIHSEGGNSFNVFRSLHPQPSDRLFDGRWNYDARSFLARPETSPYSADRTMYQHRGYNNFTGSGGCQTFPVGSLQGLATTLSDAATQTLQPSFFYLLRNF